MISIPPFWWGLWDIARGIYGSVKTRSLSKKGLIVRGVIINQVAWFLPYIYVAIVARNLPWYIWTFIAVVVTCSAALFVIRLRQGRVPARLPRFLRRRLARELEDENGSPAEVATTVDQGYVAMTPTLPESKDAGPSASDAAVTRGFGGT